MNPYKPFLAINSDMTKDLAPAFKELSNATKAMPQK
jgi:hypothetical protein